MMTRSVWEQFKTLLGLGRSTGDMTAVPILLRTVVAYSFTLAIVRLGSKRILSQATAFDTVIGIMLGSVMSRAIDGSTNDHSETNYCEMTPAVSDRMAEISLKASAVTRPRRRRLE